MSCFTSTENSGLGEIGRVNSSRPPHENAGVLDLELRETSRLPDCCMFGNCWSMSEERAQTSQPLFFFYFVLLLHRQSWITFLRRIYRIYKIILKHISIKQRQYVLFFITQYNGLRNGFVEIHLVYHLLFIKNSRNLIRSAVYFM